MIKNKINFAVGIFCGMCFVINLVIRRDIYALSITALATAVNITIGLMG